MQSCAYMPIIFAALCLVAPCAFLCCPAAVAYAQNPVSDFIDKATKELSGVGDRVENTFTKAVNGEWYCTLHTV